MRPLGLGSRVQGLFSFFFFLFYFSFSFYFVYLFYFFTFYLLLCTIYSFFSLLENPCCPEVIIYSASGQCCSVSLRCLLTLCVEPTLDATCALLMLHSTDVVCTSHHESQAKRVSHRRDSFIVVARNRRNGLKASKPCWLVELALRSEHLQVEIRGIRARVEVCTGGGACV